MLVAALDQHTCVFWEARLYGIWDNLNLPPLLGQKLTECVVQPDVLEAAVAQVTVHDQVNRVCVAFIHGSTACHYTLQLHPVIGSREANVVMFGFAKQPDDHVSKLDREVLFLLVHDCPVKKMGELLGRTESAIDDRIRRLKEKTGCTTLHGVVVYAIKHVWLC